jgi:hypothetical protein
MILVREISGLRFREDILRGVRLFAIVFATILLCVAAYRILRAPADVQGAAPDAEAMPSPTPAPETAPAAEASAEVHPLVVPAPPPVGGVKRSANPKANTEVPPPPPPVTAARTRRAPAPKEFESSETVALPAAPAEESPAAKPLTPKQIVGYKSLIEANKDRLPADPTAVPIEDDSPEAPAKGNRFFRAIGKIFHPGPKKDAEPLTLRPKQP